MLFFNIDLYMFDKINLLTYLLPKISKQTKEIFRGVFFQILCYQTEIVIIEHTDEIKVDSTGSVF